MVCGEPVPPDKVVVSAGRGEVCVRVEQSTYLQTGGLKARPDTGEDRYRLFIDEILSEPQALSAEGEPEFVGRCDGRDAIRYDVWMVRESGCFSTPPLSDASKVLAVYQVLNDAGGATDIASWHLEPAATAKAER